jgi:cell division protein ZapA (FtsZ GTPase activity inhibitor)
MADVISTPSTNEPVALRLIDREFLIACPPEERDGLLEAANFLDRKMRELRAHQHHARVSAIAEAPRSQPGKQQRA